MATSSGRWVKGCAIGCGVAVILVFVFSVGGSIVMMAPFREAVEMRETLAERHGEVDDFIPWPGGDIPPQRLDAFLGVRQAVQRNCKEIGESDAGIEAMDRLDDQEKPSSMEILGAFAEASKSVLGMGSITGEFFRVRNAALLEADMSLGEYTYIYALSYSPTIAGAATDENDAVEDAHLSERVRKTLRSQLGNRLAAMDERPEEWQGTEERRLLVEEIAALESHPGRLPWQSVRPPALQASLAAYQAPLAALFCPEAYHLELTRNESFGVGVSGD